MARPTSAADRPFAARLRRLMRERHVRVAELARAIAVSRQTVYQWRRGRTQPDLDRAAALADRLGVSLDWLAGRTAEDGPRDAGTTRGR